MLKAGKCLVHTDLRWHIVWLYYYKEKSIEEIEQLSIEEIEQLFVSCRSIRRYIAIFDATDVH